MRLINPNLGKLKLLMVKGPFRSFQDLYLEEREYYSSNDDDFLGVVVFDNIDYNFSVSFLRKDTSEQYRLVNIDVDIPSLEDARKKIVDFEMMYIGTPRTQTSFKACDLFSRMIVAPEQMHPYFKLLRESDFYSPAKSVIEELLHYFNDLDNNFVDQFQSKNGFDSRVWELYLRTWLREEGFNIINGTVVPDFLVEKQGSKIAIEAVTIQRRQKDFGNEPPAYTIDEITEKLENETPLMFGSSLFSKLKHTYNKSNYWDLEHTRDLPFCIAIADFQEDMSMTWSFPAIVSILYGVEQSIRIENGKRILYTVNGNTFIKDSNGKKVEIIPLFMDTAYENISAIIFSATGTLSKFNRIGRMCGLGSKEYTMLTFKTLYNHEENATVCDCAVDIVDETYSELWAEGINIFHNPKTKRPLNPRLFPNVSHHFYKDGQICSIMQDTAPFSVSTWNIRGLNIDVPSLRVKFGDKFDDVSRQWNQHDGSI